jgi:hypothetical protein
LVADDGFQGVNEMDGFENWACYRITNGRHAREGGHPVRRSLRDQTELPLEYWVTRLRG